MQWIKFPYPFALVVLPHAGASQIDREFFAQTRIGLLQLIRASLDAGVLAKVITPAVMQFADPAGHSQRRIGKLHAQRTDPFD